MNYRLYSFVANHYLSPLQCGLQTAHVVSELSNFKINTPEYSVYNKWATVDKTIIICAAGNHAGVVSAFDTLKGMVATAEFPFAIFREDEQSMNGMATACGIIVPEKIYGAMEIAVGSGRYVFGDTSCYDYINLTKEESKLAAFLKSFRLA